MQGSGGNFPRDLKRKVKLGENGFGRCSVFGSCVFLEVPFSASSVPHLKFKNGGPSQCLVGYPLVNIPKTSTSDDKSSCLMGKFTISMGHFQ